MTGAIDKGTKVSQAHEEILLEPYTYVTKGLTKDTWSKLATVFNHWLRIPEDKFKVIDDNTQMYRNAALLLDDIQDEAETRKGVPSAHCTYGVPNTLNAYYYASALSSSNVLGLDHPKAIVVYKDQLMEACRARRMALLFRDSVVCPTENEYKEMINKKTCGTLMVVVKLMQLFSNNEADFKKLISLFGHYFLILEEYERLTSITDPECSNYGEDITLGNFTFPINHAFRCNSEDAEIIKEILRKRTKEAELKKYVITILEKRGSFEHTKNKLNELKEEISQEAAKFGPNPLMEDFIKNYMNI